jgi:formyltetrahydrofolate hydrolase
MKQHPFATIDLMLVKYMRMRAPRFVAQFSNRIISIHRKS